MNREALGQASLRLERKLAMYFESLKHSSLWEGTGAMSGQLMAPPRCHFWNQLVVKVSKKALLDQWRMTSERQQIIEKNKDQALELKGNNVRSHPV